MNEIISKYCGESKGNEIHKVDFKKKHKENMVEDEPLQSTFLFDKLDLPIDKKDPASYKLEALRVYLEKMFGK